MSLYGRALRKRLADTVIRFRVTVILLTIATTLVLGALVPGLEVDSDILNYLPDTDPAVRIFNDVGTQFAGNSLAIIAVEAEDIFTASTIRTVHEITEGARQIPDVTHVTSLTDVLDIRTSEWGLEVARLVDRYHLPADAADLARLRSYVLGKDMYAGRIVSDDGTVALVIARVREGANRASVAGKIAEVVRQIDPPETIYYTGLPFQMSEIQTLIVRDLRYLLPLVSLLLILVLAVCFRSAAGVILPLTTVVLSTIWVLGVMSLLGIPLTVISNITPVVLIAIGSAYGIHFISHFREASPGEGGPVRVRRALLGVASPIILAGATTLTGFLSFTGSYLTIVRYFGLFTALGVFFATILSLTLIPAVLSFRKGRPGAVDPSSRDDRVDVATRAMDALGSFVLRREHWILAVAAVVAIASIAGFPRITREVDMLKYFPSGSQMRIAEDLMEAKFGGSIPIQISIRGDLQDPLVLKEVWRLEKFLETIPAVHNPQSIADLIAEMNFVMNGRHTIPDTREGIANLWFFLEGERTLEQLVNSERTWALLQASVGSVNTATIRRIVSEVDGYIAGQLDGRHIAATLDVPSDQRPGPSANARTERILALLLDDVRARGPGFDLPSRSVVSILERHSQPLTLTPAERQILEKRVIEFYSQDYAQTGVDSIQAVATAVGEAAISRASASSSAIAAILRRHAVAGPGGVDDEAVTDDADALAQLVQEARGDARAERALGRILPLLPQELREDANLRKRIRGSLWELNHRHVLVLADPGSPFQVEIEDRPRITAQQTGIPLIYVHLDDSLVRTQIISLLITAALVFAILAFQFRSWAAGALGVVPLGLAVLVNFGVMSYLGVPLDMATVLVGSIAIGIGIDYTIHFLWRFRAETRLHPEPLQALDATLETTGKAILINAMTVGLGFLVLLLASIIPLRHFGWLTALTMASSAAAALCVLPALILVLRPRFVGELINGEGAQATGMSEADNHKEN